MLELDNVLIDSSAGPKFTKPLVFKQNSYDYRNFQLLVQSDFLA
jgi:hypothetical protein